MHPMFFFDALLAACLPCHPPLLSSPLCHVRSFASGDQRPSTPFSVRHTMSEHSSLSPAPAPELTKSLGGEPSAGGHSPYCS